jgi:hypothetical protein
MDCSKFKTGAEPLCKLRWLCVDFSFNMLYEFIPVIGFKEFQNIFISNINVFADV